MKKKICLVIIAFGGGIACSGCSSSKIGDPNVDSIFFSSEKAEAERLDPKRRILAETNEEINAEKIRKLTLENQMKSAAKKKASLESQLRKVNADLKSKERVSMRSVAKIEAKPTSDPNSDLLKQRQNLENEIDSLRTTQRSLYKILAK